MARRSKFGNKVTTAHGRKFHSKREAARHGELLLLNRAQELRDLECQVPFALNAPNGEPVGHYIADFTYWEKDPAGGWRFVVEDSKGWKTDLYRWKARHFLLQYGREIRET